MESIDKTDDFIFYEKGQIKLLICRPLQKIGFKNAFSTRLGGISSLPHNMLNLGNSRQDSISNILENRRLFLQAIEASDWALITANQVHSTIVQTIATTTLIANDPMTCDAMVTNVPKIMLATQTADCLPILLADIKTRACAVIHAGWRGTLGCIVSRTIEQMRTVYGTQSVDLVAAFGPSIGICCFEVGSDVLEQFERVFDFSSHLIYRHSNGKAHINLSKINQELLMRHNVPEGNIFDCELCTYCRKDLFFSHRRDRGTTHPVGRLMGVIGKET